MMLNLADFNSRLVAEKARIKERILQGLIAAHDDIARDFRAETMIVAPVKTGALRAEMAGSAEEYTMSDNGQMVSLQFEMASRVPYAAQVNERTGYFDKIVGLVPVEKRVEAGVRGKLA